MKKKAKKSVKKIVRKTRVKRAKKEKKQTPEGFIFDSTIGKTDALFVADPDPEIVEALNEFDNLEKKEILQPVKKSFWQKLFGN